MGCLQVAVTPVQQTVLDIRPVQATGLSVDPATPASLVITPVPSAHLSVTPVPSALLSVTPVEPTRLAVAELCSVSGGTIVVLAASDGILRTSDGGYLLLDPAENPPDD